MDIRWLRTFVTAAETENFRKTAKQLFMAQPTITTHIKSLENYLGSKFFTRSGRNVVLTDAGKRFLPHAKSILTSFDMGTNDLSSWLQGYKKSLTIAVSPLLADSMLPHIIRQFMENHEEIEVIVQVKDSKEISELIENGHADLGLCQKRPVQPNLNIIQIKEEDIKCVCPHDGGDMESSPPIDIDDLFENETLFTYNHSDYWDNLLTTIRAKHHRIRTMVVSQVHITKRFIEEGLGFSFIPSSALTRELMEGRLLEVDTNFELPKVYTYMVTRTENEEISLFKSFLKEFYNY